MRSAVLSTVAVSVLASSAALFAQGIPPEWEVKKQLTALADHVGRVKPVLDQLKPEDWARQGAPAAYGDQLKRTSAEIDYLIGSTKELTARPEKLTTALETLFRMQAVDAMLRSVATGVRKYQNPALADLLQSLISDTNSDRDQLRQYVVEARGRPRRQLRVIDQEAGLPLRTVRQPHAASKAAGVERTSRGGRASDRSPAASAETPPAICVYCTKDTCPNHLCSKCLRCSDCCECEVPLDAVSEQPVAAEPEIPAE